MDPDARKQSAQQAQTQLTISLWIRWGLTYGAALVALVAAVSAFAEWHPVDRVASVCVVLMLLAELQIYGSSHTDELIAQRDEYSKKIREIEIGQYVPQNDLLEMPKSFPHFEAVARHINGLRWRPKPWRVRADLLVVAFIVLLFTFSAAVLIGAGMLVEHFVPHGDSGKHSDVGEHAAVFRQAALGDLDVLGVQLDPDAVAAVRRCVMGERADVLVFGRGSSPVTRAEPQDVG